MRIIYRGVYAGFPAAALHTGDLAYATDLLVLFISDSTAWVPYHDYPDYQGEKSGLYPQPEWATYEGIDIALSGSNTWGATGWEIILTHTVPAGRTLNVILFACSQDANAKFRFQFRQNGAVLYDIWTNDPYTVGFLVPLGFVAGDIVSVWGYNVGAVYTFTANLLGWEE